MTLGIHEARTLCSFCLQNPCECRESFANAVRMEDAGKDTPDLVNHPPHYTNHPSGIECIQITEHMNFCLGNALKYIWRAGEKGSKIEDLKKAQWYLNREIERLEGSAKSSK
jgi:hypothetical protein